MKRLGVYLLPPGWDASPSQGYPQRQFAGTHLYTRVVQRLDNAIHRINHYPADSVVYVVNIYPLDSDLTRGGG